MAKIAKKFFCSAKTPDRKPGDILTWLLPLTNENRWRVQRSFSEPPPRLRLGKIKLTTIPPLMYTTHFFSLILPHKHFVPHYRQFSYKHYFLYPYVYIYIFCWSSFFSPVLLSLFFTIFFFAFLGDLLNRREKYIFEENQRNPHFQCFKKIQKLIFLKSKTGNEKKGTK